MKKIKMFFSLAVKNWYYILIFVVSFLLFVRLYFPDEMVMKLILNSVETQNNISIKPESGSMSFFPVIGVSFESAMITLPNSNTPIKLGRSTIGYTLVSIVTLSPAFYLNSDSLGGHILLYARGLPIDPRKTADEVDLDLSLQNVNLKDLNLKSYIPVNLAAVVDGTIDGRLNLVNFAYSVLKFDLSLSNVKVVDSNVMGYVLPAITLKKGAIIGSFDKSNVNVTKIMLGSGSEDLDLFVSGQVKIKFNNPYEGKIRLKLGGALETQFGQFLNMSLAEAKGSDGYYGFKIKGDMKSFPPQIIPEK